MFSDSVLFRATRDSARLGVLSDSRLGRLGDSANPDYARAAAVLVHCRSTKPVGAQPAERRLSGRWRRPGRRTDPSLPPLLLSTTSPAGFRASASVGPQASK